MMTSLSFRSCCKRYVTGWNHGAAYELSKMVDVGQAKVIRLIFDAGGGVEDCCHVAGPEPVGYPHLIEIGISNKREQAAVLVLPAEASDAGLSRSLKNGGLDYFPMNSTFAQLRLLFCNRNKSAVVNGFHKSIP